MAVFNIEVHRRSDGVCVALTTSAILPDSEAEQMAIKEDAKRLSAVYGRNFYVEVWTMYNESDPFDYNRNYVMHIGHIVSAVGF